MERFSDDSVAHIYKGKTYSLADTLRRSVGYWCKKLVKAANVVAWDKARDSLAEIHNPFYPKINELTQVVWQKLLAAPKIEEIWNGADGFRSVSRYVARVVSNALIDEKRRRETQKRKPEILAVNLDEPFCVADEGTAEADLISATLADLIPGEVELDLPFAFEELRSEMTAEEFCILESAMKNGATIRELAQQRGESKSKVGLIAKSAKSKSRKWIKGLRRGPHQRVKARFLHTLGWGSSLRPDHIAKEVLESWNALPIVPFHDPASEWRPPITKALRVRAKRECWNTACQNGLAIGPDNLVLPAARRHEAVRFLPAFTGQDNRKCAGCEQAAKRADTKISSDETTGTVSQIGLAKPNVWAIPKRDNSVADVEEQRNFFIEDKTRGNFLRSRDQTIRTVIERQLPKQQLADIAGVPAARLSDYLRNRPVPEEQCERITEAVTNILMVWKTFAPIKIALDDPVAFAKAVELANQVHAKLAAEIAQEDVLRDLPTDLPELRIKPVEQSGTAAD